MADESKTDDGKIVDFQAAKQPHAHVRREKKVADMRQAFENYLSDGKPAESRQVRRKKQREKNKRK